MTPFIVGSYLTCEEFRAMPTALATNNLIPGGDQDAQDAELAALIARASRQIDSWARQALYATPTAQNDSDVRVIDGDAVLHPQQDRVKIITSFAWGPQWTSMATVDGPTYVVEDYRVRVSLGGGGTTWTGGLSALARPQVGRIYVSWSYVAGWATTRLAADAQPGDTTITVEQPAGIVGADTDIGVPGTWLRLVDGPVQATYQVSVVDGPLVTLTTPLAEAWPAGAAASEVPDDIKDATMLVVVDAIQRRQGTGLVMQRVPQAAKVDQPAAADGLSPELAQAKEKAERYLRPLT